jgi:hypothetical protein
VEHLAAVEAQGKRLYIDSENEVLAGTDLVCPEVETREVELLLDLVDGLQKVTIHEWTSRLGILLVEDLHRPVRKSNRRMKRRYASTPHEGSC